MLSTITRTNLVVTLLLALCGSGAPLAADEIVRLATTTTTDNSGLIDYLLPAFEAHSGYQVHAIATGSGRALRLLANGDVDVALTHAPDLEAELLRHNQAVNHRAVMYNDFVLVGPRSDPAGAGPAADILQAFAAIASHAQAFVSRADNSGTHAREQKLWQEAGLSPAGEWYREAGQGMGRTLEIADELNAYTLVDRGTWLAYAARVRLVILIENRDLLFNRYSVLSANPALHHTVNAAGAAAFTTWLLSPEAKRLIRNFRINGQQLFVPLL